MKPRDIFKGPKILDSESVGKFFRTRGGWVAIVIHHEYNHDFYCIHLLGPDGLSRTDPIKHYDTGEAHYDYPSGSVAPIPKGTHPADLLTPINLVCRWNGELYRYSVTYPDGTPWNWSSNDPSDNK